MYIWTGSQWRKVGDGGAIPTLQQVTTAGNSTDQNIIAESFATGSAPITQSGEVVAYNFGIYNAISDHVSYFIPSLFTTSRAYTTPDTTGTLSVGVKVNGTTYMAGTNGIADLGTISSDTTSLSNRINERVKYTDTAAMLSPYLRSNVAAATYQPIGNYDTATVVKAYVTNAEAVTITKGQVVYIFGASGDRASVKLANNTSDTFSSKTLGIVRADIAAGAAGWITTQGQVSGINLSSYSPGDILWLDSVAGGFTKNKPQAPYHSVFVGVVERANAGNGLIYVKPQNGVELDELHDVRITSLANNEIIRYNSSLGYWENKSITTTLGYTPLNVTDTTAMLTPYLRKVDTASLSNRINLKLNISDSSAMLTPYLRKVDTLSLSNRINAVAASGGVQWTGIDSVFGKSQAENGFHAVEEFISTSINEYAFGTNSGAGFSAINYDNANAIQASTGTSSTSSPAIRYKSTAGSVNLYTPYSDYYVISTRVYLPDLNDGTQKYYFHVGAFNGQLTNTLTQCAAFLYDLDGSTTGSAASANWQCVTGGASTRTYTTTSTAVAEDVWVKLTIVINNSNCFFYINGNLVATHTTNLPTNVLAPTLRMIKTAGIVARTFAVDYVSQDIKYSTAR
jgi:hypothetical protein